MSEFQTEKKNPKNTRLVHGRHLIGQQTLSQNQIRVGIESFSFTANNITYANIGEELRYWEFFPASENVNEQWGLIPVWGFANVVETENEKFRVGDRLFGYFPPAELLVMTPIHATEHSFTDASEHRADLPITYNQYQRYAKSKPSDRQHEHEKMLLYPLHLTSFCLYDMLQSADWFDADQIIITSASSKTAIGVAYALQQSTNAPKVMGLTSTRNLDKVKQLGIYDYVYSYFEMEALDDNKAAAIIDMSSNGTILTQLHGLLKDNMKYCSQVGLTHAGQGEFGEQFIKDRSHMFFAPAYIAEKIEQWGIKKFQQESMSFIDAAAKQSRSWLNISELHGLSGLESVYMEVLNGLRPANEGIILKL